MRSLDALSLAAAGVLVVAACNGTNSSGPADASSQGGDSGTDSGSEAGTEAAEASTMLEAGGPTADGSGNDAADGGARESGSDADSTATNDSGYDGGPVACGTMTCAAHEVCLLNKLAGGAYRPPDDAGNCPDGEVLDGVSCDPAPSYQCVEFPPACSAGGLSCGCAQSLCQDGYNCMSVSGGVVGCYVLAP